MQSPCKNQSQTDNKEQNYVKIISALIVFSAFHCKSPLLHLIGPALYGPAFIILTLFRKYNTIFILNVIFPSDKTQKMFVAVYYFSHSN